jgi:hypothetical protein
MSGHIDEKAGFLAALAKDDPERRQAEEHARSCASCREALDEGRRLVELLSEALPLDPPTQESLDCAAQAIDREQKTADRSWRLLTWVAGAGMALGWVLQLFYSKRLTVDPRSVVTSLAVLGATIAAFAFIRDRQRYVVATLVLLSGLFALLIGAAATSLETRIGVECTMCELVAALIPWLAVIILAKRNEIVLDRITTMAAAAGGAIASQAAQLMGCPVPHARAHLLVFHFGGVLLALAIGAINPLQAAGVAAAHQ